MSMCVARYCPCLGISVSTKIRNYSWCLSQIGHKPVISQPVGTMLFITIFVVDYPAILSLARLVMMHLQYLILWAANPRHFCPEMHSDLWNVTKLGSLWNITLYSWVFFDCFMFQPPNSSEHNITNHTQPFLEFNDDIEFITIAANVSQVIVGLLTLLLLFLVIHMFLRHPNLRSTDFLSRGNLVIGNVFITNAFSLYAFFGLLGVRSPDFNEKYMEYIVEAIDFLFAIGWLSIYSNLAISCESCLSVVFGNKYAAKRRTVSILLAVLSYASVLVWVCNDVLDVTNQHHLHNGTGGIRTSFEEYYKSNHSPGFWAVIEHQQTAAICLSLFLCCCVFLPAHAVRWRIHQRTIPTDRSVSMTNSHKIEKALRHVVITLIVVLICRIMPKLAGAVTSKHSWYRPFARVAHDCSYPINIILLVVLEPTIRKAFSGLRCAKGNAEPQRLFVVRVDYVSDDSQVSLRSTRAGRV